MRRACFTSVERKALAHDLDRLGLAGAQLLGAMDWMPEAAHELPGDAIWPSGDEIFVAKFFMGAVTFTFGLRHFSPRVFANLNSKSEYRNPKQTKKILSTKLNWKSSHDVFRLHPASSRIVQPGFEFVSGLRFRASDFHSVLCVCSRYRSNCGFHTHASIRIGVPTRFKLASKRRRISTSSSSYSIIVPPSLTEI